MFTRPPDLTDEAVVSAIDDRYLLAVYPHIEGVSGAFGPFADQVQRVEVVDLLVALHRIPTGGSPGGDGSVSPAPTEVDDHTIASRDLLAAAMGQLANPWSTGPYGEPTRALLRQHGGALQQALAAYDELAARVGPSTRPSVITHGEPHPGNVIRTPAGSVLIDWDTTLIAPPERDLWRLVDEDPDIRAHYEQASGRALDDEALRLYGLWWDLCEVALFVSEFRRPHLDTADTRTGWQGLQHHLDPTRWGDTI